MRRAVTACALLIAADAAAVTAAEAAVPPAQPPAENHSLYRVQGLNFCISANRTFTDAGTAMVECRCAVDRLISERGDALPAMDENNAGKVLEPYLAQCRSGAVEGGKVPTASAPVAGLDAAESGSKPVAGTEGAPAPMTEAEAKRPAPAWLAWTGLPLWALWLIPGFALLAGLVLLTTRRRRGGRGDLIAPPPSMRGDAVEGPSERE